jgi:hypothetical protein
MEVTMKLSRWRRFVIWFWGLFGLIPFHRIKLPMARKQPLQPALPGDYDFGPVVGKPGDLKRISVTLKTLFRGQKLCATDTSAKGPGYGTQIVQVWVAGRAQIPVVAPVENRTVDLPGILTALFSYDSLGSGTKWDTCQPEQSIDIDVYFFDDCTWSATVYGQEVR